MNVVIPSGANFLVRAAFNPDAQGQVEQTLPITLAGGEIYLITLKGYGTAPICASETWDCPMVSDAVNVRAASDPKFKAFTFNFGQVPVGQKMVAVLAVWNRTAANVTTGDVVLPFGASRYTPDVPKGSLRQVRNGPVG